MLGSRVYVGTWSKYNDGNLDGEWVELSDFDSWEDFEKYAKKLHSDEKYPELMYQDWDSIPQGLVSEYHLDHKIFDLIRETADFDEDTLQALWAWISLESIRLNEWDIDDLIEKFNEAYQGYFATEKDFAYYVVENFGYPENMENFFNYDQFATELFISDYYMHDGYVYNKYV